MEEIMISKRKFVINIAIAISTVAMSVPLMAEPWALSTADSDYWSEQQRSRKNLKRIRGLFERLKTPQEVQSSARDEERNDKVVSGSSSMENSEVQWNQNQYRDEITNSRRDIPHYLGSQREEQPSSEFFVFGQDDPDVLLPSARQVPQSNNELTIPRGFPGDANDYSLDREDVNQEDETQIPSPEIAGGELESNSAGVLKVDGDVMEYVVRPGDSLRQIARKIYQEPKRFTEIMQWNNLPSHNIFPGQKLKLERVTKKQRDDFNLALEQEQRNLFPAQLYKYKVHKVRSGDSLARISKMYLGSQKHYAQLARLNELDSRRYLKIGQKLIVPIRKEN